MDTMACNRCLFPKPLDEFGTTKNTKNGRTQPCKECRNKECREIWRAKHPLLLPQPQDTKRCRDCLLDKSLDDFPLKTDAVRQKSYPASRCHPCYQAHARARYALRMLDDEYRSLRRELNRQWQQANPEKVAASTKRWNNAHPEAGRAYSQNHRAKKAAAPQVDLSNDQWLEILQVFNYRCSYCPPDCIACRKKTHTLEQEHITPVTDNGSYTLHNIIPACRSCNAKKHTGPAPVFVQPLLLTIATSKKPKAS